MITLEGMIEAQLDCRKRKRRTASATEFELQLESNLVELVNAINTRTYRPGKSTCFVVKRPKLREVFAASYKDRVIHHWVALRLEPLFEKIFTCRTFNCRKDKGQLYGIRMLYDDIKEVSENYTKDCWVMKCDLQGFFMSIDKQLLCNMLDKFIVDSYHGEDKEDLRYVCRVLIMHQPEKDCEQHSPVWYWDRLPKNKSLFTNSEGKGLAIGNLFSQHDANFYLNMFDWYVIRELGFEHYGRYVDDFYIVSQDKQKMLEAVPKMRAFLKDNFMLTLHPKKFYLQHYTKGVMFTGSVVKPGRTYTSKTVAYNLDRAVDQLNKSQDMEDVMAAVCSVNSYLGQMIHCRSYNLRKAALRKIDSRIFRYLHIKGSYQSLHLNKKYTEQYMNKWRSAA